MVPATIRAVMSVILMARIMMAPASSLTRFFLMVMWAIYMSIKPMAVTMMHIGILGMSQRLAIMMFPKVRKTTCGDVIRGRGFLWPEIQDLVFRNAFMVEITS